MRRAAVNQANNKTHTDLTGWIISRGGGSKQETAGIGDGTASPRNS